MSRFLVGDDLGNLKVLRRTEQKDSEPKDDVKIIHHQDAGVQKLAMETIDNATVFSAAFSNGSCLVSSLKDDDSRKILAEWKEPRITSNRFIGIAINQSSVYTCTSNGMLRRTAFTSRDEDQQPETSKAQTSILPSRLYDWRLSSDATSFAYGGDEVELSVWDTERAFQTQDIPATSAPAQGGSKKRKRNEELFAAEQWRARNVPNDSLTLRQPVRITTLTYLASSSPGHHLMTGTQFGDLRRYDTKAARRPVSNWVGVAKVGGVKIIEKGLSEHELFMSDGGFNLSSIDLRTGGILYSISGAVTSIAPSPTFLVSTASDRYARFHSVVAPPATPRAHQEHKGQILDKTYLTSTPTAVVWDKHLHVQVADDESEDEDDDEVWDQMEHIG
ncbi:hypothetical protein D9613_003018 [Agrocybe pediades]|uniref:Ribosome biogenesis protein NSA1 n=1 Tax=Agrocybe pediades TaxID=84607 RepID=A0A8H4QQB5_9AGAR|nr:hypothetical protein D9613_003018 [Agrocybe pediades]